MKSRGAGLGLVREIGANSAWVGFSKARALRPQNFSSQGVVRVSPESGFADATTSEWFARSE